MATMGRYCKAYLVKDLAQFGEWAAQAQPYQPPADQEETEPFLFLHENYTVTGGIFLDEDVVFTAVTPEWKAFCDQTLAFAPPPDIETDEPIPVDEVPATATAS